MTLYELLDAISLAACELLDLVERNGIGHVIDLMPAVEAARAAIALYNPPAA